MKYLNNNYINNIHSHLNNSIFINNINTLIFIPDSLDFIDFNSCKLFNDVSIFILNIGYSPVDKEYKHLSYTLPFIITCNSDFTFSIDLLGCKYEALDINSLPTKIVELLINNFREWNSRLYSYINFNYISNKVNSFN